MVDPLSQPVLSLQQAAAQLPAIDGQRPGPDTVRKWCCRGVRGIRLDHARVGRRIVTTEEAIRRFLTELTRTSAGSETAKPRPAVRRPRAARIPRGRPQDERDRKLLAQLGFYARD